MTTPFPNNMSVLSFINWRLIPHVKKNVEYFFTYTKSTARNKGLTNNERSTGLVRQSSILIFDIYVLQIQQSMIINILSHDGAIKRHYPAF